MLDIRTNSREGVFLVSQNELTTQQREAAVWESMYRHKDHEEGSGVWDPQIWRELESPSDPEHPAPLFLVEPQTGSTKLVSHLGCLGLESSIAS